MRLLVAEDDAMLADAIARALSQSAHVVDVVRTGPQTDGALTANDYALVILDVGLPGFDGFEVLRRVRQRGARMPVLIMTARDSLEDTVRGLDLGADDYITKPFHLFELEARVRALIRRSHTQVASSLTHGRVRLELAARRLFCDDQPVEVTAKEFAVMELLLLRAGRVVTKQQMLDTLYGWDDSATSNTVEVFIHRLRKKLETSGIDIRTVRGMGYLIDHAP